VQGVHNFQEKVVSLQELDSECPNFSKVAEPYINAARWEQETGESIVAAVGLNSAVDMSNAVDRLKEVVSQCTSCDLADRSGCPLNQAAATDKLNPAKLTELIS
jgi:hypothetical protein